MKKLCILLVATVALVSSCQRSEFPITTRHVKNGTVNYVNHHPMEWKKTSKGKSDSKRLRELKNKNQSHPFCRKEYGRNSTVPEIVKMNPVKGSVTENLIASTNNSPGIFAMNVNPPVSLNVQITSNDNNHSLKTQKTLPVKKKAYANYNRPARMKGSHKSAIEPVGLLGFILSALGLISVIGLLFPIAAAWMVLVGISLGIIAIILGAISIHRINRGRRNYEGKGFAIAALIIGILTIIACCIIIGVAVSDFSLTGISI
jgi:hypothetical protein